MKFKTLLVAMVAGVMSFGSIAQTTTPPPAGSAAADTVSIGGFAVPTVALVATALLAAAVIANSNSSSTATATSTATGTR